MESNFKLEKDSIIPQDILHMYKVDGRKEVDYKKYIECKNSYKLSISPNEKKDRNLPSLIEVKNHILGQDKKKIKVSIVDALNNEDIEVQRMAATLVEFVPTEQQNELKEIIRKKIIEALNNQNIEIQRIAINMIKFVSHDVQDEIRPFVYEKIMDAFNSSDIVKQKIMAKKIDNAPNEMQNKLREMVYDKIYEALNKEDIKTQRIAATMVRYAISGKQEELKNIIKIKYELAKKQKRFSEIVEPNLYMKSEKSKRADVSHEKLSKTGAEMTLLLGDKFRNNLIVRHFEKPCFLAWQKAYENYTLWKKAGFDYVPIEPIYSFRTSDQDKMIDVASGVLDLNLEEWYAFSGDKYKEHLDEMKNKIINSLKEIGISHGHSNDGNFCLRFSRNEKGEVDLEKIPKIYLIDFDRAMDY